MEICTNLYKTLVQLRRYTSSYKLVKIAVNRTTIARLSDLAPEHDLFSLEKEAAIATLEEKLKMIGVIGKSSLACGSPYHNMPIEITLYGLDNEKAEHLICVLEEYPKCCGSAIIKNFIVWRKSMNIKQVCTLFIDFMNIVYTLVGIMGYSSVSYILSSGDNEELYSEIDFIKIQSGINISHTFVNKKTEALCTFMIKDV